MILPASESRPGEEWLDFRVRHQWIKIVPRSAATRLFVVRTVAKLDGLTVHVSDIDAIDNSVLVHARYPGGVEVFEQLANPLHPDMRLANDVPTASDWFGRVAADRLEGVHEAVEEVEVNSDFVPSTYW